MTKAGYGDQLVALRHRTHFGAFFLGNRLSFLGIGMIVDTSTGGMYEIQPADIALSKAE